MQKAVELFLEIIGWLQITVGTTFLSGFPALFILLKFDSATERYFALAIVILGFITGAAWATRIWIKHGTVNWLSGIRRISKRD